MRIQPACLPCCSQQLSRALVLMNLIVKPSQQKTLD